MRIIHRTEDLPKLVSITLVNHSVNAKDMVESIIYKAIIVLLPTLHKGLYLLYGASVYVVIQTGSLQGGKQ